jgi:integrase
MRKTLTDKGVAALKPRPKGYAFPDPELRGHYVRVRPSGVKTFTCVVRDPRGKQIWTAIGAADKLTISEARTKARKAIERVREGLPALEEPQTKSGFEAVAEEWLKRHVRAKGLRSEGEVTRLLQAHVFPRWKGRNIIDIRRSHVAALLDHVEDNHGARQADYVLAIVRGIMNWYATRHDDYVPPVAKGMRRTNPKERARSRVLTDDEIRAIWGAADGTFGAVVKMLLLTGQRREKILSMRWQDVSLDGEWTIPSEAREKGNAGALILPEAALSVVVQQPRIGDNPYVFAGRGEGHINGPSKAKRQFDAKLPEMPQWQLHDCRRTFRSLLSRAGVSSDIAERLMGHAMQGVEGVYDRHSYRNEKADALKRLAALISEIVSGEPSGKVVKLRKARADA